MTPPNFWNQHIITVPEIASKTTVGSDEPMVIVQHITQEFECRQLSKSMAPYVGPWLVTRSEVAMKLIRAQRWITERRPEVKLCLLYGYRHPDVQRSAFEAKQNELRAAHPELSADEVYAKTNQMISDPAFAGHPTGGAIDVTLCHNGRFLPMGTDANVFIDDTAPELFPTFASAISSEARGNRLFLREALMTEGFAPFNGEWWHFSYGDRDWAFFYQQPHAIYDLVPFEEIAELIEG